MEGCKLSNKLREMYFFTVKEKVVQQYISVV